MILRPFDFDGLVSTLPAAVEVREPHGLSHVDVFIGALGFEDRTAGIAQWLADHQVTIRSAIICQYEENLNDNERMRPPLEAGLKRSGAQIAWTLRGNLNSFLAAIEKAIEPSSSRNLLRVVIDISSMSGRVLLSAIGRLMSRAVDLTVLYCEASSYLPSREDFQRNKLLWRSADAYGLEVGVGNISVAVDFRGKVLDDRPDWVVVFAGFGRDRVRASLSYVNPALIMEAESSVGWAIGVPHLGADSWRTEAVEFIHEIPDQAVKYRVDTFDYRATLRTVDSIREALGPTHNLSLVPLGSKMQNLALGLYCSSVGAFRVISGSPSSYRATEYTKGIRATWCISLGNLTDLRRRLEQVGTLEWVEE